MSTEVVTGWITDNCKAVKIKDHQAAGTSDITSDEVDARGFSRAVFRTSFSAAADNNLITVHQSATSGGEAASVAHVHTATSGSYEDLILEIAVHPDYPFLKLVASVGTSSTVESMWCDLWGARTKNQTSVVATTLNVATFDQPALA